MSIIRVEKDLPFLLLPLNTLESRSQFNMKSSGNVQTSSWFSPMETSHIPGAPTVCAWACAILEECFSWWDRGFVRLLSPRRRSRLTCGDSLSMARLPGRVWGAGLIVTGPADRSQDTLGPFWAYIGKHHTL